MVAKADFAKGIETQKEIEIVKKHKDIFTEELLMFNAEKRAESISKFRMAARKIMNVRDKFMNLKANQSTPVHQHLIHHDPELWIHHHSQDCTTEHRNSGLGFSDVVDLAHKMSENKEKFIDDLKSKMNPEAGPLTEKQGETEDALNNSREVHLHQDENECADQFSDELDDLETPHLLKHRSVVKMDVNNIEEISEMLASDKINIGMTLLKRLRKYRLISSIINHEGKLVVGIAPRSEGRIIQLG